jgi:hypothetical protein
MTRQAQQLLIAIVALAIFALIPAAIKADPVIVTGQGTVALLPGGSSGFNASVTNLGPPRVFLNSLAINFSGPAGITFSDTPFFANTPAFLDSGQTTGVVSFFDVFVDISVPPGLYSGSFTVLGGDTDSDLNDLGTQPFAINVLEGSAPPIPEPATMFLLATGLGGAVLARRRAKPKRID